jgi:SAM-dependent methyltransferase
MPKPISIVAAEFDAIANALERTGRPEVLTPAHRALLDHLPREARRALDVGCGDGMVTRAVAGRGVAVLGVDVSPRMVALARARTDATARVEYRVADIMADDIPEKPFDVVMSINVVHHVPLGDIIPRLAGLVAPGGTLLIQDVVTRDGLRNFPLNVVAAIRGRLSRLVTGSWAPQPVAALYETHGAGEVYLEPEQVAPAYATLLPGARVLHHLEWRYSVVWRRPPGPERTPPIEARASRPHSSNP